MKQIDIVVPCYNEEAVVETFYEVTSNILKAVDGYKFKYIMVDDGSRDNTLNLLRKLASEHDDVNFISFSRNFGKEAAMFAGLKYTSGDYVVVMDADLQHPPTLIPEMIKGIEEGYDCCAAMRRTRKGESKLRSFFSRKFYGFSNRITNVNLVQNAVDFRLMTRQMVDSVISLSEYQRFSKGIFAWVGYNTKWIPYDNVERTLGQTKWSFTGLLKYAIDGITAFSVAPLRFIFLMGFFICSISFIYILVTIILTLVNGISVPGYVTTLSAVMFLGGITELSIGVLGEYIGHIYMEAKDRPIFIMKETNIKLTEFTKNKTEK